MPRIAFVSPLPPAPTGVADYAADVLGLLAPAHDVEAFCDQPRIDAERLPASVTTHPASDLDPRHRHAGFDLTVYQMGNAVSHAFEYELLARRPGLVVLHDLVLHHARARHFLDAAEVRAYRADPADAGLRRAADARLAGYAAELERDYPGRGERIAAVQLGTVGTLLPYAYPLFGPVVSAARAVAVHNACMADAIREARPDVPVCRIPMPVEPWSFSADQAAAARARLGVSAGDVVVVAFGLVTPEKQIPTLARAVARAAVHEPRLRLLLVGEVADRAWLDGVLARHGVAGRSVVAGRVPRAELAACLAAADVAAHLRYPTARETSAALLRMLAQGLPVVASDLENLAEIPDDAVVRADPTDEEGALTRALLELAARPERRRRLAERARAFVVREHAPARCAAAYEAAIALAVDSPTPSRR